ncbi:phage head closure protein [Bacillus cytotoxicus]
MPSIKSNIGNSKHISLDDVCFLISSETEEDELGQVIDIEEKERQIFCSELSISQSEFYAAGQLNRRPQIMLVVDSDEYDKESKVKHDGTVYSIYRSFMRSDGFTELYCEVKIGD